MTCDDILKAMDEMENGERIKLLLALYDKHYDKGIPKEQLEEENRILEAYYNGYLVEVDEDDYSK